MLRSLESALTTLARKRFLSCVLVFALAIGVRLALLPISPIPYPQIHDEFSYIFGAETFADGRLTTATHPMWRFFETYHINMQPTYASKYPPGQALFLALGIVLFGNPWYGVLISVAMMCGCLCWMLQGWMPPKYALVGGLLAMLEFSVRHDWVNSYWGGAVAATGGALVFGALPRLARDGRASAALAGAVGIAILANSRPFEGLVLVLLCFATLLIWTRRRLGVWVRSRVVLILTFVLLSTAGAMAYYNFEVTGSAVTFPYSVNQKTYAVAPVFWVMPAHPAVGRRYRDDAMQRFWEEWDLSFYTKARHDPLYVAGNLFDSVRLLFVSLMGSVVFIGWLLAILLFRTWPIRLSFAVLGLFLCAMMLNRDSQPHYLAPVVGVYFLIAMSGFRLLCTVRVGGERRRVLILAILGLAVSIDAVQVFRHRVPTPDAGTIGVRERMAAQLDAATGKHLVLVHYSPDHDSHQELVYNTPDIDAQKVIWAFDFGPEGDRPIVDYYRDRKVWLLRPDGPKPTLEPYPD